MNQDKSLITSVRTTLYQKEKLVDKIQFILPRSYQDLDLTKMKIVLKYLDVANTPHTEILVKDDEIYKENYMRCVLPVDTNLTEFSGDISIRISFVGLSSDGELHEEVLHTGETTITINPLRDYYAFTPDESLEFVDKIVANLEAKIDAVDKMSEAYDKGYAYDLTLNEDLLQVSSKGKPIGNGVKILVPSTDDGEIDGVNDGILNLNNNATN